MKLTNKQKDTLLLLNEEKSISKTSHKINRKTMNSLYFKRLVELQRYANGEFWEKTEFANSVISKLF